MKILTSTIVDVAKSQLGDAFERVSIDQGLNRDGENILYIDVIYNPQFEPLDTASMLAVTNILADSDVTSIGYPVVSFISSVEAEPSIAAE